MTGRGGYFNWSRPMLVPSGRVYLGGRRFDNWLEVQGGAFSVAKASPLTILKTHAGTNILQSFYPGDGSPLLRDFLAFSTGFLADSEADYFFFEYLRSTGTAVSFFPGYPVSESFQASGGQAYKLLRTPAAGNLDGVTLEDFPISVMLDGESSPGAAVIAGNTVVAVETGVITISYHPLFQVVLVTTQDDFSDANNLVVTVSMVEARA